MRTKLNNNTFYQIFKVLIIESPINGSTKTEYNIFCKDNQITKETANFFCNVRDFALFESENRMRFTGSSTCVAELLMFQNKHDVEVV
jgi:hypothetical protein